MPLPDHFRPPLFPRPYWESFPVTWAGAMADALNEDLLPAGYFTEEHAHAGARVEVDVATVADDRPSAGCRLPARRESELTPSANLTRRVIFPCRPASERAAFP